MSNTWMREGSVGAREPRGVGVLVWAFAPRPVEVETADVTRGPFRKTVDEDGKTRVRDRYVVSAPFPGRLLRVELKPGAAVEPGTLLATPRARGADAARRAHGTRIRERLGAAEAEQLRANAAVERASVGLEQAKAEEARAAKLAEQGFTSRGESRHAPARDRTQEERASGRRIRCACGGTSGCDGAGRAAASRQEAGAGAGVRWEIHSPVAGQVLRVAQESEGVVAARCADPRNRRSAHAGGCCRRADRGC